MECKQNLKTVKLNLVEYLLLPQNYVMRKCLILIKLLKSKLVRLQKVEDKTLTIIFVRCRHPLQNYRIIF